MKKQGIQSEPHEVVEGLKEVLQAKLNVLKLKMKLIQEQLDLLEEGDHGYHRPEVSVKKSAKELKLEQDEEYKKLFKKK